MKKYNKVECCLYILLYVVEYGYFNKSLFLNVLCISELDYFRYKNDVLCMLHDFYRFDILEKIDKNKP